jgi:hypothetical protein
MDSPDGLVKTRTLAEAMAEMGYVVSNVGERELANGYDSFAILRKRKFPFISANLVFQSTGKTIVEPYTIMPSIPRRSTKSKKPLRLASRRDAVQSDLHGVRPRPRTTSCSPILNGQRSASPR